jgi:hypothetical protein
MGWELWRQDEHGHEFLVATFASEDEARRALDAIRVSQEE